MQVLSSGLNFAPTPRFIPKAHIVVSVEAAIAQSGATDNQATRAQTEVIGALCVCVAGPQTGRSPSREHVLPAPQFCRSGSSSLRIV